MKKQFYIPLLLVFISSCDPCNQCGEPLNFDPTVELIFINTDTLLGITEKIEVITETLEFHKAGEENTRDSLESLEARLLIVDGLIQDGDLSYEEEKASLTDLIGIYLDSLADYALLIDATDSIQDFWIDLHKDVSNGLIKIDTLFIEGQFLVYKDSSTSYHVPLLMNEESFTQYEVVIGSYSAEIAFDYDLEESVDVTREIKLRAKNIHPVSHTFESISDPQCKTSECLDHETTVYLYF